MGYQNPWVTRIHGLGSHNQNPWVHQIARARICYLQLMLAWKTAEIHFIHTIMIKTETGMFTIQLASDTGEMRNIQQAKETCNRRRAVRKAGCEYHSSEYLPLSGKSGAAEAQCSWAGGVVSTGRVGRQAQCSWATGRTSGRTG